MKKPVGIFACVAGAAMASIAFWSLGCEQIIGLDGPYAPASSSSSGGGGASICMEGATEECYSGDPALKGIGACQSGTRTCAKGTWGACAGEGAPSIERCAGNDDDCDGNATCTGQLGWALSFGGAAADSSTVIGTDASGNAFVAGSFSGSATFGGAMHTSVGGSDVVVFKLDPSGKHIWSKTFGSTGTENARGAAVDAAGNVIVIGAFGGPLDFGGGALMPNKVSFFVAKLDPNGAHIWSRAFTGADGLGGTDATVDASGNVLISISLTGSMDFGSGLQTAQNESLAIVKLDSSGKTVWSKLFGSSMCCGGLRSAVAVDSAGNVGIAGTFFGTMTFAGTTLTSTKRELFLAKLSPAGDALWSVQGTAATDSAAEGLAFDKTGALIIAGTFPSPTLTFGSSIITGYSNADAFVAKFDANGAFAWGKAFGMGGSDEAGAEVEADAANNISFSGTSTSNTIDFGVGALGPAGIFVVKLDPTGTTIWARTSDVATTPFPAAAIAVDNQGHTLLTRGFSAPLTIGGVSLPSLGMTDMFVIKLGP